MRAGHGSNRVEAGAPARLFGRDAVLHRRPEGVDYASTSVRSPDHSVWKAPGRSTRP